MKDLFEELKYALTPITTLVPERTTLEASVTYTPSDAVKKKMYTYLNDIQVAILGAENIGTLNHTNEEDNAIIQEAYKNELLKRIVYIKNEIENL